MLSRMEEITTPPSLTESQSLRAMHLFMHGSTLEQIADSLSVPLPCVERWRQDFEAVRANAQGEAASEQEKQILRARRAELVSKWQSRVATESAAIAVDAFEMARDAVNVKDTRGFADAARGIGTMVQLARQAEGLDKPGAGGGSTGGLSVFVLQVGENGVRDLRPMQNVTPQADPSF